MPESTAVEKPDHKIPLDRRALLGAGVVGAAVETIVTDRGRVQIKISGSFFVEDGQIVEWFELVEPQG